MGIVKKQSLLTGISAYLGVIFGAFNTLFLFPKYLHPDEIGLINILISFGVVASIISQLGIPQTIIKFFPFYKNSKDKKGAFFTYIVLLLTIGLISFIVFFLLFKYLLIEIYLDKKLFIKYINYCIPITIVLILKNVFNSFSRVNMNAFLPNFLRDVLDRILNSIVIIVYVFAGLQQFFFPLLYTSSLYVGVIILITYLLITGKINFNLKLKENINRAENYKMFNFGLFVILANISGVLLGKIDIFMIGAIETKGLTEIAIYSIAIYIATVIEIPKRAINQIATPIISQKIKEKNNSELEIIYKKSASNLFIVGSIVFIMIWCNIDSLFSLIPNSDIYKAGKYVVLFFGLGKLFDMSMGMNSQIIMLSNHYKKNMFITLFLLIIALITNYLLIPKYGIIGAAIATAISMFLYNIIRWYFVRKWMKITPFSNKYYQSFAFMIILFGLSLVLPSLDIHLLSIVYKCAVLGIIFVGGIYYFKLSEEINEMIDKILFTLHLK